jgi:hypothetical protein
LRARPAVTSAEFIQVFGYGGAGSLALNDLAARRPQTAQGARDLEHFQGEACPGLDPGWIPVRARKDAKNKFSARHHVTSAEFVPVIVEPRRGAPGLSA